MTRDLPRDADVLILGGGIVGCSVAYHLAELRRDGVHLLEQQKIAGGTTWHAAGLVGRLRASNSMTRINQASVELYSRLEQETGVATGWRPCGSLIVARNAERMTQLRRTAAMARVLGVEAHMISAEEAGRRWPRMRTDDLLGGAWLPGDGRVVPQQVAEALAAGARQRGATLHEGVEALDLLVEDGRVTGVRTRAGEITASTVVLCGGMWTRDFAARHGITIPLAPVEHHYVVSDPIDGIHDDLPVTRDPDGATYFRPEGDAILLGAFQAYTKPWIVDRIPNDFSFQLLEEDWDKFEPALIEGRHRLPDLVNRGFQKFVNGPESFTPDNNFILGEVPEVRGVFVAAGFNSAGIACAGGAGQALARWIEDGAAPMDLWSVDPRRFLGFHNDQGFLRERITEVLGLHYQMAWPNREMQTGRDLRHTPLHSRLKERGACFGAKMGWERPNWFASEGVQPRTDYTFGKPRWLEHSAREHLGCRERVALFDQCGFSKLLLVGPDALSVLQPLCGGDVDVPVGRSVYTGLFNERGTFESDLTVLRTGEDRFEIITATAQTVHDQDWIRRHMAADSRATLTDITERRGVIGVMGPRSRDLLAALTETDLSHEGFPFASAREVRLGDVPVLAVRITYVGELGFELHAPIEHIAALYDLLREEGERLGVLDAGHAAINSMRLEKGYLAWGADLSPDETPLEAGLSFAIAWDKSGGFLGREALLRQKHDGPRKRVLLFVLEDADAMLWGNEPIYQDGEVAGYTTSGAYGHSLGAAVAAGYVPRRAGQPLRELAAASYEIEVDGRRVPARAFLRSPFDPERRRILT